MGGFSVAKVLQISSIAEATADVFPVLSFNVAVMAVLRKSYDANVVVM